MPTARFWRIVGATTYDGGDLELSAFNLHAAGGRADVGATLTSSHTPISGSLANLLDADTGTACRFSAAQIASPGFHLQWDMGVGVTKDVIGFRVGATSDRALFLSGLSLQFLGGRWENLSSFGRVPWPGASTLAPLIAVGDTDYDSVTFLARAAGADGATTFVDASAYARTLTARSGAKTSTDVLLFGSPMMYFDGVNDYAEAPSGPEMSLPGDFTLDIWAHPMSSDSTQRWLFGNYTSAAPGGLAVWRQNGYIGVVKVGVTGVISPGTQLAPTGQLSFIRVTRSGTTVSLTVNDVAAGSYTGALDFVPSGTPRVSVGALVSDANGLTPVAGTFFHGFLAVRLTKGVVRTGTAPVSGFPEHTQIGTLDPLPIAAVSQQMARRLVWSDVGSLAVRRVGGSLVYLDAEAGGAGRVRNTVKEKGAPNLPVRRRVRLVRERDGMVVREQWSDPATGAYDFQFVDERQTYTVLSYDHTLNFRAVIADGLTLANGTVELMP